MGGGAGTSGDGHVGLSQPHMFTCTGMACVYGFGLYVCGLATLHLTVFVNRLVASLASYIYMIGLAFAEFRT